MHTLPPYNHLLPPRAPCSISHPIHARPPSFFPHPEPCVALQQCFSPNDGASPSADYFSHKRASYGVQDIQTPSPATSPHTFAAPSLRTTRRVKTNDDIAQSHVDRTACDKRDARRHAKVFEGSWTSVKAHNENALLPEIPQRQRNTRPKEQNKYIASPTLSDTDAQRIWPASPLSRSHTPPSRPTSRSMPRERIQHLQPPHPRQKALSATSRIATISSALPFDTTDAQKRSNSHSRLKNRMLSSRKNALRLGLLPLCSAKRKWDGVGTNAPIAMTEVRVLRRRGASLDARVTQVAIHPALLPPATRVLLPDPRHAARHAILVQTRYGDPVRDDMLPGLWAKLRAGVHAQIKQGTERGDDKIRRQLQTCRGLSGSELEDAVKDRVKDLHVMGKWVEKWKEKGI